MDGFIGGSEAGSYRVFKDGVIKMAGRAKDYASEVEEKISEQFDDVRIKVKAYIGPVEEAEEFTIDNRFIVKGYRINHTTCKSLCRSLFTCHNEFVNVWSHITGVTVFLILLIVLCVQVIPTQFWYANSLDTEYGNLGSAGNPVFFINGKITDLQSYQT